MCQPLNKNVQVCVPVTPGLSPPESLTFWAILTWGEGHVAQPWGLHADVGEVLTLLLLSEKEEAESWGEKEQGA